MTNNTSIASMMQSAQSTGAASNHDTLKRQAVQDMIRELEMIEQSRKAINDIAASLQTNLQVPPKVSKKVAKIIHKQKKTEYDETSYQIDELLNTVAR